MNTCRLCHGYRGSLIKYGVRHYAHADCGLQRWGAAFFDRLHDWQLKQFPYFAAKKAGLAEELVRRVGTQSDSSDYYPGQEYCSSCGANRYEGQEHADDCSRR